MGEFRGHHTRTFRYWSKPIHRRPSPLDVYARVPHLVQLAQRAVLLVEARGVRLSHGVLLRADADFHLFCIVIERGEDREGGACDAGLERLYPETGC